MIRSRVYTPMRLAFTAGAAAIPRPTVIATPVLARIFTSLSLLLSGLAF
jgi:hypothetical protein